MRKCQLFLQLLDRKKWERMKLEIAALQRSEGRCLTEV